MYSPGETMREFANEILQIYSVTISFCYHGTVLSDSILCFLALSFLFYITRTAPTIAMILSIVTYLICLKYITLTLSFLPARYDILKFTKKSVKFFYCKSARNHVRYKSYKIRSMFVSHLKSHNLFGLRIVKDINFWKHSVTIQSYHGPNFLFMKCSSLAFHRLTTKDPTPSDSFLNSS